jgi:hypothetical protein
MSRPLALVLVSVGLLAVGCGSNNELPLAPVRGHVTYHNQPLAHGEVVFTPTAGTPGPQAVGSIQSDGSFDMQTLGRKGAVVGRHIVTVHCRQPPTPEQARSLQILPSLIPERYGITEKTPLRFEVQKGSNTCPLVLE